MPNPKSALRFPKTQLFRTAAAEEAAKYVASQPGNEIQEDPLYDPNELSMTAEESAKTVAPEESDNTTESPDPNGDGSGHGSG